MPGDEDHPAPDSSPQQRVAALLNERVAASSSCPRCGSPRVQRWGKIQGVQRLRCRACARTFNPLTGTPLARLRRRDLWLGHARVLEAGLSLRRAARAIGVHYNTTLRWRHRWLERPSEQMARSFTGMVAAEIVSFEPCAHQPRGWTRVALPEEHDADAPAGERHPPPARAIPVLLLRDQCGARADAVLSAVTPDALAPILDDLLDPAINGLCSDGRLAARACCSARGIARRCDAASCSDRRRLVACRQRLRSWMRRFAGVATHRLANYLGWRRLLEGPDRPLQPAGWLARALGHGQQPTVTRGDGAAASGEGRGDGLSVGGLSVGGRVAAVVVVRKPCSAGAQPAGGAAEQPAGGAAEQPAAAPPGPATRVVTAKGHRLTLDLRSA